MNQGTDAGSITELLSWLADAPMFADEKQIAHFYDAVVQPVARVEKRTVRLSKQLTAALKGTAGIEVEGKLGSWLSDWLLGLSGKVKGSVGVDGSGEGTTGEEVEVELFPIETPQRQLVQLTLFYLTQLETRLFFVRSPDQDDWRQESEVSRAPRMLVFLDFGGQISGDEAIGRFRAIPTAAEFQDGHIEPFYQELSAPTGERPPKYPEDERADAHALIEARKQYWHWFSENVSPNQAMTAVERAASRHGRIRWIDYRVMLDADGNTLHLHCAPDCQYDTGTFAYQLIKRGSKHGLRLVGTMKSEPAINLLAAYEK